VTWNLVFEIVLLLLKFWLWFAIGLWVVFFAYFLWFLIQPLFTGDATLNNIPARKDDSDYQNGT